MFVLVLHASDFDWLASQLWVSCDLFDELVVLICDLVIFLVFLSLVSLIWWKWSGNARVWFMIVGTHVSCDCSAYSFDWDLSRVLSLSGCLVEAKMVVQFQLTVMWTCNGLLLPLFFVEVILYFVQFSCSNQIIQNRLLSFTFCILLASSHFQCKWNCVWFTWMEVFFFFFLEFAWGGVLICKF